MKRGGVVREIVSRLDYASAPGISNPRYEKIDCGLGNSPFPFPVGVMETVRSIEEKELAEYPSDPYTKGLGELIRQRFRLSKDTGVFFNGQGSYGLLASILSDLVSPLAPARRVNVIGYGPQFTNIAHLAERVGLEYFTVQPPIETSVDSKIVELTNYLKKLGGGPQVVYVDTPNNPTGEVASQDILHDLLTVTAGRGDLLIFDEAFGDAVPDYRSNIPTVEKHGSLIVTRSLAKVIGLASPRLGWGTMSEPVAKVYDSINLVFGVDTLTYRVGQVALDPKRLASFLPKVRRMTAEVKTALVQRLEKVGVKVHPTEAAVNIFLARGQDGFYGSLLDRGIVTEDGATFKPTHREMDGSWVRFRIPGSINEVDEIVKRIRSIR